jgi:hypothetical protein
LIFYDISLQLDALWNLREVADKENKNEIEQEVLLEDE